MRLAAVNRQRLHPGTAAARSAAVLGGSKVRTTPEFHPSQALGICLRLPTRRLSTGILAALLWSGWTPPGYSAITYIDATSANTVLQGGGALLPGSSCTTGPADGSMDGLWHLRTGVGNGDSVWTADEAVSGTEDPIPLITTISFPSAGAYRVYAYIWTSLDSGQDWDAKVRLGGAGGFSTIKASVAGPAIAESFTGMVLTAEESRRLIQVPLGIIVVSAGGTAQVWVDDDTTVGSQRTWYDGIGYERVFSALDQRIIALDFNKTNVPGAPSQAMFRVVNGSQTTSQNTTNIQKAYGPWSVQFRKTNSTRFDFQGANGDSTRAIPGGATGLSFLVSDFIGSRDGIIRLDISNLAAGTYFFRSYHLEPLASFGLGYAQGSNSVTPNTIQARVGSVIEAVVQPTAMSSTGLGTTFIGDADIPTLTFPFTADGINPATIELSSVYGSGATKYIFMNGFEIFSTLP